MSTATSNQLSTPLSASRQQRTPFFKPYAISQQHKHGSVTLREYTSLTADMNGATVLEGFPTLDNGLTSIIVANFLIKELKMSLVGDMTCPMFPPVISVKAGVPIMAARIYGTNGLIIFVSEYRLQDPTVLNDVVAAIHAFSQRHKCKTMISLDSQADDPTIDKDFIDDMQEISLQSMEGDEGEDEGYDGEGDMNMQYSLSKGPNFETKPFATSASSNTTVPINTLANEGDKKKKSKKDNKPAKLKIDNETSVGDKKKQKNSDKNAKEKDEKEEQYEEKVWFLTNAESIGVQLLAKGYSPIREFASRGVAAGLLNLSSVVNVNEVPVNMTILVAPLDALHIGTKPAVVLLKCLSEFIFGSEHKVKVNIEELQKATEGLEKKIQDIIGQIQPGPMSPLEPSKQMIYT